MTYALGTSRATITKAPLLLIDLDTEEGVTGRAYLFCYLPAAAPRSPRLLERGAATPPRASGSRRSTCGPRCRGASR